MADNVAVDVTGLTGAAGNGVTCPQASAGFKSPCALTGTQMPQASAVTATVTAGPGVPGQQQAGGSWDRIMEFMSRVVPWPASDGPGFVNLHHVRPNLRDPTKKAWSGKVTRSPADFVSNVQRVSQQPTIQDIYFCLSLQSQVKKNSRGSFVPHRNQKNAISLRSLWIDIDVKAPPKGYATTNEAIDALRALIIAKRLPPPSAVVMSGSGGMHVYWIGNRDLMVDEWMPLANGLKQAALDFGLRCDAGCTIDSARVLRVPGTFNYKHTRRKPVKLRLMQPADKDYDLPVAFEHLVGSKSVTSRPAAQPAFDLSQFPKRQGVVVESLSEGINRGVHLLDWVPIYKECAFIRNALTTGGKDYSQSEWNLTTLAATFLEDGHALAHKMGNKHPGYTAESTDALWERKVGERKDKNLGWPSCSAIQDTGCSACATCPHFAKGKSPLHLAQPTVQTDHNHNAGQSKGGINPVAALMTLQNQGAAVETLLLAMNETFAVVKYGSKVVVASIIGKDLDFMKLDDSRR